MTARRAEARSSRSLRTSVVVAALTATTTATLALAGPASAAWQAQGAATTAPLQIASWSTRLDSRSAGGATAPVSNSNVTSSLSGGAATFDAVNTGSVPAQVTTTLTVGGLVGLSVALKSCPTPYTAAGTCAAGESSTSSTAVVLGATSASLTAALDPGERRYLRISTSSLSLIGAVVLLQTSAVPSAAPSDRTLG